jgi:hypothetical protein
MTIGPTSVQDVVDAVRFDYAAAAVCLISAELVGGKSVGDQLFASISSPKMRDEVQVCRDALRSALGL